MQVGGERSRRGAGGSVSVVVEEYGAARQRE